MYNAAKLGSEAVHGLTRLQKIPFDEDLIERVRAARGGSPRNTRVSRAIDLI
jgi:hypothetical protein